ncbi:MULTISPECIES: hypothetical protein [unclassified Clostridium]|uniref:hypothetical protein n=1 Tax=unclassified Clostridium TaxID=2614128 RepID=UPI0013FA6A44|nr:MULTISPECIES: hypothetical protein [unclassified Clostridium]MBN1053673.1 hypothetical protein [Clostridium botulinum]NFR86801.1 hypothetical protein [Clostridium botulinum]NFR91365.1 hypothetical protein [Clostridium botulinum]NFT99013.1 hypothetical protein [Clostridium botulinum]
MKKILLIPLSIIAIIITLFMALFMSWTEKYKTTNISDYSKYLGQDGEHNNSIFPYNIPSSAKIQDFCYYYYNPFDPNYVSYLVYSCDDVDYAKETERLSKLESSKDYLIYSATGFKYPVCAVYADSYNGYIYALADKENNRLIYVEINFCNYFSDIDYEEIIDKQYLPIDFNAKSDNPTKRAYQESLTLQESTS